MPDNNTIVPITRGGFIQPSSQRVSMQIARVAGGVNHIAPTTAAISSILPRQEILSAHRDVNTATVARVAAILPRASILQRRIIHPAQTISRDFLFTRDNMISSDSARPLTASTILAREVRGDRRDPAKVKSIRINTQRTGESRPGLDTLLSRGNRASELNPPLQQFSRIHISDESKTISLYSKNDGVGGNKPLQMQYVNTGASTSQQQTTPVTTPAEAGARDQQSSYRGEGDQYEVYAQTQQRMVILTRGEEVYTRLPNLRSALMLVNKVVAEVVRKIKKPDHVGEVMDAIAFCTGIRPGNVSFTIYRDFLGQVESLLRQAATYLPGKINENQFAIVQPPVGNNMAAATIPQDIHHRIWLSHTQATASIAQLSKDVIHELGHMFTTVNPAFDFIYLLPQGCNEQEVCDVDELQRTLINEVGHIGHNVNLREAYFNSTMNMLKTSYPEGPLQNLFNATTSAEAAYSVENDDVLRYMFVIRTSDLLSMLVIKLGYEKFLGGLPPQARSTADPVLVMAKTEAIQDTASINQHLNVICKVMSEIKTDFRAADRIMRKLASIALPYPAETARWLTIRGGELPYMMGRLYHHQPRNSAHVLGTINCILTWLMERGDLPVSYVEQCILPIPYTYYLYKQKNSNEIWQDKLISCWADFLRSYLRRLSPTVRQQDIENLVRILFRKSLSYNDTARTVQFYKALALELERRMNWFNRMTKNKQTQNDEPKRKKVKITTEQPDSRLVNLAIRQRWYVSIEDVNGEFLRGFNPAGERISIRENFDAQLDIPVVPNSSNILCVLREYEEDGQLFYNGIDRYGRAIRCGNDINNLSRAAMTSYLGEEPTEEEVIMLERNLEDGEDND